MKIIKIIISMDTESEECDEAITFNWKIYGTG